MTPRFSLLGATAATCAVIYFPADTVLGLTTIPRRPVTVPQIGENPVDESQEFEEEDSCLWQTKEFLANVRQMIKEVCRRRPKVEKSWWEQAKKNRSQRKKFEEINREFLLRNAADRQQAADRQLTLWLASMASSSLQK